MYYSKIVAFCMEPSKTMSGVSIYSLHYKKIDLHSLHPPMPVLNSQNEK